MTEYGLDVEPSTLLGVVRERRVELATLTDELAESLGKPELRDHGRVYRADARNLAPDLGSWS